MTKCREETRQGLASIGNQQLLDNFLQIKVTNLIILLYHYHILGCYAFNTYLSFVTRECSDKPRLCNDLEDTQTDLGMAALTF